MRKETLALPELFLERLRRVVPSTRWEVVVRTFTAPKPTTLRVNTLKASVSEVRAQLTEQGFLLEDIPWYRAAFLLRRGCLRELQETDLYRRGAIYVQSLSSMLPPLVLDPQPGELVLDIAAAPGSKTTQMACLMQGRGRIVANDNHRIRFYRLKANVTQQGAANVDSTLRYGESFGSQQPETFDRVLVDAPCTAEGRFLTAEPSSYRFWKPSKVHEMVRKQRRLLRSAIEALKPGGVLVYATCTFAPEENEGVLHWAMERYGAAITLEPFPVGCSNVLPGLRRWGEMTFHASLTHARRILPTSQMEGFFIARLKKQPLGASPGAVP